MARARSTLNRYADGLLKILKDDAEQNPEKWFRVPAAWKRGVAPEYAEPGSPDPVLCVSLNGDGDQIAGPMELGAMSIRFTFTIAVMIRATNADEAAGEMWDDIRRVLNGNRQLSAVDDPSNPTILSGYLRLGNWSIAAKDGSQGEATIEQHVIIQNTLVDSTA